MVVTDGAKNELKKLLTRHRREPGDGLRLAYKGPGRLGFVLDEETDEDQVITYEGQKILLIDRELESLLRETILTVDETNGRREFVIGKS